MLKFLRSHAVVTGVIAFIVIFVAVLAGRAASQKTPAANTSGIKQVTLVNAATFREGQASVSADGTVESHSQADLKAQTSAPISSVSVAIGDSVYPGQVLVELSNSDIRAQLAQAQASLAVAEGQFQTGTVSLSSAKQSVIDKLRDAYNKTYAAVYSTAEPILFNNNGNGGRLTSFSSDQQLNSDLTAGDTDVKTDLTSWKSIDDSLDVSTSTASIMSALTIAQKSMDTANTVINDMTKIMNTNSVYANQSFATILAGWQSAVSGARDSMSAATQALTAAKMALDTANSSQGGSANAQIAAAQAGVSNLQAQLAKTIITSPIYGKVSALPLREGELASPGTLVASVIGNDSGLVVKAYVSGEDLSRIHKGAQAVIQDQGTTTGTVSNVAPGVDPTTRKAEVDIDVNDPTASKLVIGDTVNVSISAPNLTAAPAASAAYILPIQDVKIDPGAAYVFTVDQDSKIVSNPVTLGPIQGDFVEVTSGMNDGMNIVSPVYELDAGQQVTVQ